MMTAPPTLRDIHLDADMPAGLPVLTGSPKQIAWAETIRREARIEKQSKYVAQLDAKVAAMTPGQRTPAVEAAMTRAHAALAELHERAHAGWWIDHREQAATWVAARAKGVA